MSTNPTDKPAQNAIHKVKTTVKPLTPNTTYHYRVCATNQWGKTCTADMTFTTKKGGGTTTDNTTPRTLKVQIRGSGFGGVYGSNGQYCHDADCTFHYRNNEKVELGAAPDNDSKFSGFSNCGNGGNPCRFTITSNHEVTARFSCRPEEC